MYATNPDRNGAKKRWIVLSIYINLIHLLFQMNSSHFFTVLAASMLTLGVSAAEMKLSGSVVGTDGAANAFDGNTNTALVGSSDSGYRRYWAGLDLGKKHIITKVGIRPSQGRADDMTFALVQGASRADFSDALPIAMITQTPAQNTMTYYDVEVSRGFSYVRVMAAPDSRGYFAEIEFYGEEGEGDDSHLYQFTNLPTVVLNTPGMAEVMSKEDKHSGSYVAVISDNGTTILDDTIAQIKGRGNASWDFPKKPYQIKFDKKKQILADAPAKAKKWTLINNYGDKTLMRNKVAFDMSREIGLAYTPYCRFVDMVFNGQYMGCYQLCDQIEVNPGRVEVTEMAITDVEGDALTGGYLIEVDAYADREISWFRSNRGIPVTIKSPKDDEIVSAQTDYIRDYFNRFEAAVFASDFADENSGYRQYLDLQSFLRYFIVCELDGNTDSFWSTYLWKERNDPRFHVGPVWDIDLGFDNDNRTYPVDNLDTYIYERGSVASESMRSLVTRIVKTDKKAADELSTIWSQMRHYGNFNAEYFEQLIDTYAEELQASQSLNFRRWRIMNEYVHQNPVIWGSYQAEVQNVKNYIRKRFDRLDRMIGLKDKEDVGPSRVEALDADKTRRTVVGMYDLQGRLVPQATQGIYICRYSDGTSEKIVLF